MLEPRIGEALEHLVRERARLVRREISRGDDLLEQQPFQEGPEPRMRGGVADRADAGEERQRRRRRVHRIEQAQLALAVEPDVACEHHRRAFNGENRA